MKTPGKSFLVGLLCAFFATSYASGNGIIISDAWIPERPPVSANMAGYLILENTTDNTINLIGVRSPVFSKVEVHKTVFVDGLGKMMRQDIIEVPPGESLVFEPGSYHLMLMRPSKLLTDGDSVQLQFLFDQGQSVYFEADVIRPDL